MGHGYTEIYRELSGQAVSAIYGMGCVAAGADFIYRLFCHSCSFVEIPQKFFEYLPFVAQAVDEAVNTSGLNHRIENETFNFMVCDFPVRKLIEIHF